MNGSDHDHRCIHVATPGSAPPHTILPHGATAAFGGWINDANQIAGSYEDLAQGLHGFVYHNGAYVAFDLPVKPDALTTQGIDQDGRVVGVFTKGVTQFAFVHTAIGVTLLRRFPAHDTVHVAASHFGHFIAISDTAPNGVARSFLAVPAP